ncbi:MAG: hypothetical protein VKK32_02315 [Candidatus Melainabacteria bacterium]|nr:hypothetical protein [Candidatus Melainabacteria bacterium]
MKVKTSSRDQSASNHQFSRELLPRKFTSSIPSAREKNLAACRDIPSLRQVERMISSLFSVDSRIKNINEITEQATQHPELFRQVILNMIKQASGAENTWDKAIKIAEILSLPQSSRSSSQASFADELKMEINTQRFIRDMTWHVTNVGFAKEGFSVEELDFRGFQLPVDKSVVKNALRKIAYPEGPFGNFGLDLAIKFTADTKLRNLHTEFSRHKDLLSSSRASDTSGSATEMIGYSADTDNHAQNKIMRIISDKVGIDNPDRSFLIQLFMIPNSFLPNNLSKNKFLQAANELYTKFADQLNQDPGSEIDTRLKENLYTDMALLIREHFRRNDLEEEWSKVLAEIKKSKTFPHI